MAIARQLLRWWWTVSVAFLLLSSSSTCSAQEDTNTTTFQNACDNITLGEFTFLLVSSSDPFDEVSFFGFEDLPPNLDLYLTDNAWTGTAFQIDEGVMKLTTPPEGIPAATTVGLGPSDTAYQYGKDWQSVQGVFSLSTEGEQVFLYCLNSSSQPRPIAAISYNGP